MKTLISGIPDSSRNDRDYTTTMGRITYRDCKSVEGGNLKLVINSTSEDAMILELQNINYNMEKWGKIKTFVMLVAFLVFSTTMNITNVYIFAIAIVLLVINVVLLVQLVDTGKLRRVNILVHKQTFLFAETLSIIRHFTVQKTTKRAFGREEHLLVPSNELKSVVINEVFDNVRKSTDYRVANTILNLPTVYYSNG